MTKCAELFNAIAALLWPILGLTIVFLFKVQIREFFRRFVKGKFLGQELELGMSIAQQTQVQEVTKGITKKIPEQMKGFLPANPPVYLNKHIELIRADLISYKLDSSTERDLLVYALAASQVLQYFERLARIIFGSQLQLLVAVNAKIQGAPLDFAREIFNAAARNFPDQYRGNDFVKWLGFLTSNDLIIQNGDHIVVTPKGRDFMKYLVDSNDTGVRTL